jgi:cytidine deaminase/ribosomal protein S18 acetylase RimI-like enzyme
MKTIVIPNPGLEIRPVQGNDLDAILRVYRQCEDFLALGPVAAVSIEMVLRDLEISREEGGVCCGMFNADGKMLGGVDYVPGGFEGNPQHAYLSLLMIAAPFRKRGLGRAIVEAVEREIRNDPTIQAIRAGVQVNNHNAIRFWQKNGYQIVSGPKLMPDQTTVFDLQKDLLSSTIGKEQSVHEISNLELIEKAKAILNPRKLFMDNTAGDVACALVTPSGNIYLGVCIDTSSGMGFCAEHSAVAAMITAGETSIAKIVAVWGQDTVLPPCGRCREFIYEIDETNWEHTDVILGVDQVVKLKELLPHPYHEVWSK